MSLAPHGARLGCSELGSSRRFGPRPPLALMMKYVLVVGNAVQIVTCARVIGRITDMSVEPEDILDAAQERIMIVGRARGTAGIDEWREQERADPIAAVAVDHDVLDQRGGVHQRESTGSHAAEVWTGLLVATGLTRERDVHGSLTGTRIAAHVLHVIALIEGDDEQAVLLVCR